MADKHKKWHEPAYMQENDKRFPKETSPAGKDFLSGKEPLKKHTRRKVARKR